ncbi:hypothetical protein [Ktedonobacter racemifer]|uniref:Uncharacterized protein n=1 Tax=Ktedonobacter racemifer DSM 44963 TaxID=485913 RepID=D6TG39_KTERA|nr:hypothetical protein [Ktedonobacter racemifer]EFH88741.1 hypothetical protein Krac_10236 [Ktedonobacter racemifer DSM 44963]
MSTIQETHPPLKAMRNAQPNEHPETVVTAQGVSLSVQGTSAREGSASQGNFAETLMPERYAQTQRVYPAWPTSRPGPQVTHFPPGQKPHPKRTDQMVYDCYDQERGRPCVAPATQVMRETRARTYHPDDTFLEVIYEAEVTERWRDDGNASETEAIGHWLDDGGLSDAAFEMGSLSPRHNVQR